MESRRCVLTTGKAPVIRDVLKFVLAGSNSEGDITDGTRERLWSFVKDHCDRMILDLRTVEEPAGGASPGLRKVRISHLGQVLVVTGEVTTPEILRAIDALRRPHFFPRMLTAGLFTLINILFLIPRS